MLKRPTIGTMRWRKGTGPGYSDSRASITKRTHAKVYFTVPGGIALWNLQQTDYRRKPRATWTRYEVSKPLDLPDNRRQSP